MDRRSQTKSRTIYLLTSIIGHLANQLQSNFKNDYVVHGQVTTYAVECWKGKLDFLSFPVSFFSFQPVRE